MNFQTKSRRKPKVKILLTANQGLTKQSFSVASNLMSCRSPRTWKFQVKLVKDCRWGNGAYGGDGLFVLNG